MRLILLLVATILAIALSLPVARAAEDYDGCTHFIESTPITISTGGTWCLNDDLVLGSMEYGPITIKVPNVTIDCNHFALDGSALPEDTGAIGIMAWESATNTTVRNCDIRGFMFGMSLYGGGVVEDNLLQGTGSEGIYIEKRAIIRRNRLRGIGNSASGFQWAYGIVAFGDLDIIDNDIEGLTATAGSNQSVIGIVANVDLGDVPNRIYISGNRIRGLVPDGTGQASGIESNTEDGLVIVDNVLYGNGENDSIGIYCLSLPDSAISGNIIFDFGFPVWGCTADSDNSIKP